jgi:hypothetical protein
MPSGRYDIGNEDITSNYELSAGGNTLAYAAFTNSAAQKWVFTLISTVSSSSAYYYINVVSGSLTCNIDSSQATLCNSSTGSSSQQW